MLNNKKSYPVFYDAYTHYKKTGETHFDVLPKNPDYLLNALNTIEELLHAGFVTNVSEAVLDDYPIGLSPIEPMSFDLTLSGIDFINSNWET